MPKHAKPIPLAAIESRIHFIRGNKVMLDADLAELYGVTTGNLNKALERNREPFPYDFVFRLAPEEFENLIFQFGISSRHGGRRHAPYAFTQEGIAMPSSVLRSRAPSPSMSRSCAPSYGCAGCWFRWTNSGKSGLTRGKCRDTYLILNAA